MTGVLKARTAVGPDVWTPVSQTGISLADISPYLPRYYTAVGNSMVAAAYTTETVSATLVIPAQSVAGVAVISMLARTDKTVATDTHVLRVRSTNVSGAVACQSIANVGTSVTHSAHSAIFTTAGVALTIVETIQRTAGSGNVTLYPDATNHRLSVVWMSDPP